MTAEAKHRDRDTRGVNYGGGDAEDREGENRRCHRGRI
jgi:hypothetical protein